jgi:hypothetical protein
VLLCGSGTCIAGLVPDLERASGAAARLSFTGFRAVVSGPVPTAGG